MKFWHLTQQEFIKIVRESFSITEVRRKIGLGENGGNHVTIKKRINELKLDVSHMTGQLWSKGKKIGEKYPIEDYLSNKRYIHSHKLKLRLIKEGIFTHKCYCCDLKTWNNLPIPIELHHKDGDNTNNNLENIIILCPNCHAQTDTHAGKNVNKSR